VLLCMYQFAMLCTPSCLFSNYILRGSGSTLALVRQNKYSGAIIAGLKNGLELSLPEKVFVC